MNKKILFPIIICLVFLIAPNVFAASGYVDNVLVSTASCDSPPASTYLNIGKCNTPSYFTAGQQVWHCIKVITDVGGGAVSVKFYVDNMNSPIYTNPSIPVYPSPKQYQIRCDYYKTYTDSDVGTHTFKGEVSTCAGGACSKSVNFEVKASAQPKLSITDYYLKDSSGNKKTTFKVGDSIKPCIMVNNAGNKDGTFDMKYTVGPYSDSIPKNIPANGLAESCGWSYTISTKGTYTYSVDISPNCVSSCSKSMSFIVEEDCTPQTWYKDSDGDGYGISSNTQSACPSNPPPGYADKSGDCDDSNANKYPNKAEQCNGYDDNCNYQTDENSVCYTTYYCDKDNDGYKAKPFSGTCNTYNCILALAGCQQSMGDDCDDTTNAVNPGKNEVCGNSVDENCNNQLDDGCGPDTYITSISVTPNPVTAGNAIAMNLYVKNIGSTGEFYRTFKILKDGGKVAGDFGFTYSLNSNEEKNFPLDYTIPLDWSGIYELVGTASKCSPPDCTKSYLFTVCTDADGDTYGTGCANGADCDDGDKNVHPNAQEQCNGYDDDCDGTKDEGCQCVNGDKKQCGTTDVGECSYGTDTCVNGKFSGVCAGEIKSTSETCNNKDDNCDTKIDDNLICNTNENCGSYGNPCDNGYVCVTGTCKWTSNNHFIIYNAPTEEIKNKALEYLEQSYALLTASFDKSELWSNPIKVYFKQDDSVFEPTFYFTGNFNIDGSDTLRIYYPSDYQAKYNTNNKKFFDDLKIASSHEFTHLLTQKVGGPYMSEGLADWGVYAVFGLDSIYYTKNYHYSTSYQWGVCDEQIDDFVLGNYPLDNDVMKNAQRSMEKDLYTQILGKDSAFFEQFVKSYNSCGNKGCALETVYSAKFQESMLFKGIVGKFFPCPENIIVSKEISMPLLDLAYSTEYSKKIFPSEDITEAEAKAQIKDINDGLKNGISVSNSPAEVAMTIFNGMDIMDLTILKHFDEFPTMELTVPYTIHSQVWNGQKWVSYVYKYNEYIDYPNFQAFPQKYLAMLDEPVKLPGSIGAVSLNQAMGGLSLIFIASDIYEGSKKYNLLGAVAFGGKKYAEGVGDLLNLIGGVSEEIIGIVYAPVKDQKSITSITKGLGEFVKNSWDESLENSCIINTYGDSFGKCVGNMIDTFAFGAKIFSSPTPFLKEAKLVNPPAKPGKKVDFLVNVRNIQIIPNLLDSDSYVGATIYDSKDKPLCNLPWYKMPDDFYPLTEQWASFNWKVPNTVKNGEKYYLVIKSWGKCEKKNQQTGECWVDGDCSDGLDFKKIEFVVNNQLPFINSVTCNSMSYLSVPCPVFSTKDPDPNEEKVFGNKIDILAGDKLTMTLTAHDVDGNYLEVSYGGDYTSQFKNIGCVDTNDGVTGKICTFTFTPTQNDVGKLNYHVNFVVKDDTEQIIETYYFNIKENSPEIISPKLTDKYKGVTQTKTPEFIWKNIHGKATYTLKVYNEKGETVVNTLNIAQQDGEQTSYPLTQELEKKELDLDTPYWWEVIATNEYDIKLKSTKEKFYVDCWTNDQCVINEPSLFTCENGAVYEEKKVGYCKQDNLLLTEFPYCTSKIEKTKQDCSYGCFDGNCLPKQDNVACYNDIECPQKTEKYCLGNDVYTKTTGACIDDGLITAYCDGNSYPTSGEPKLVTACAKDEICSNAQCIPNPALIVCNTDNDCPSKTDYYCSGDNKKVDYSVHNGLCINAGKTNSYCDFYPPTPPETSKICNANEICSNGACTPKPTDPDTDTDGVPDKTDNCISAKNPDQKDNDLDGKGDACDDDDDNDAVPDNKDNCVLTKNFDQKDNDLDGKGDACDDDDDNDGVVNTNDCSPLNKDISPNKQEICNNVDDDCDGTVDEGVTIAQYKDNDFDGYGNKNENPIPTCKEIAGYAPTNDDCDDTNSNVYPTAEEICDGLDNDCNGLADDGIKKTYYYDGDGDGFGSNTAISSCQPQENDYVTNNKDCDDKINSVNPDAQEICNTYDDDCDGVINDNINPIYVDCNLNGGKQKKTCNNKGEWKNEGTCSDQSVCTNGDTMLCQTSAKGECGFGVKTCANGAWGQCATNKPKAEECNDKDDDCDGEIDEGLIEKGEECIPDDDYDLVPIEEDNCPTTYNPQQTDYDKDGIGDLCDDDDDNDGAFDSKDCAPMDSKINPFAKETCNYQDDNCDNIVDNGFDFMTDNNNCGGCGKICKINEQCKSVKEKGTCKLKEGMCNTDNDCSNDEICADNICVKESLPPQLPDLYATSPKLLQLKWDNGNECKAVFEFTVENKGETDAENIKWVAETNTGQYLTGNKNPIPKIKKGKEVLIVPQFKFSGTIQPVFYVDKENTVAELNEDNNFLSFTSIECNYDSNGWKEGSGNEGYKEAKENGNADSSAKRSAKKSAADHSKQMDYSKSSLWKKVMNEREKMKRDKDADVKYAYDTSKKKTDQRKAKSENADQRKTEPEQNTRR